MSQSTSDRLAAVLADRYHIERELGTGGMAVVYLAHDMRHDRSVAIKVLRAELAAAIGAQRFLAEIKNTANLQHPHILSLFDSGEVNGTVFYVMPFVDGESLRDRLTREKQLPIDDAVRIAREVADALNYAHQHGIVHRDIKPENILLQDGHALIVDFGIALAASRTDAVRMTEAGMSLGTPQYMSPEQATGERGIDARTDIYALGVVLYEMLAGEPPYTGNSAQQIIMKIVTEDAPPVTKLRRSVPPNVSAAIAKALEKVPADRFATAAAFANALDDPHFANLSKRVTETRHAATQQKRAGVVVGAVALLVIGFLVGHRYASRATANVTTTQPVLRFQVPPIPGAVPLTGGFDALFPDGSGVVFIGDGPGGRGIWVESLSGAPPRFITAPDAAIGPLVLPDHTGIAYDSFLSSGSRVNVASLSGAPIRVWTDSVQWGIDVDQEGRLYSTLRSTQGLARVARTGEHLEHLTVPDASRGERRHSFPQLLPAGHGLLFQIVRRNAPIEVAALDLASGRVTVLADGASPGYLPNGYIVFRDTAESLLAARFSVKDLRLTSAVVPVLRDVGFYELSRNGTLVYEPAAAAGWTLGTRDAAVPQFARTAARPKGDFRISPDGDRVIVAEDGGLTLIEKNRGGRRLILPPGSYVPEGWAGNGKEIVVLRTATGDSARSGSVPYLVSVNGALSIQPVSLPGDPAITQLDISPTGTVYTASGQIWWLANGASRATPIARGSGPEVSPDGRYIAFDQKLRVLIAALSPRIRIWDVTEGEQPHWSPDGKTLFFVMSETNEERHTPKPIMKISVMRGGVVEPGVPELAEIPPVGATNQWGVGPRNGLIYWQTTPPPPPPMLVVNWGREVDSLVRAAGDSR